MWSCFINDLPCEGINDLLCTTTVAETIFKNELNQPLVHEKVIYRGGLPKKGGGAWTVCRFPIWGGAWQERGGGVFEGEELIPQCTLCL